MASATQWDAGRKCERDVPRAARRPQTSEHGCSSMPSCCTHCMLRYRRTWTPQHPRAIRFHRQGKNTGHVHNVTSTSHQSSCTRPWACGPSVMAREASLVSHPILMYPSFRVAKHPNGSNPPPPQKDCQRETSVRRQGSGVARNSAPRNATQQFSCWPLAREFSPALPPTAGGPWHVGEHEDLSKLLQAPDAEGVFGPARCTARAIQGAAAGTHQPAMSSRSLAVLAPSGFFASPAMAMKLE